MFSRGIKVLIAVLVIGLLLTAGIAFAKPGHGHAYGKNHVGPLSHGKSNHNNDPGTTDKKGRVRISLIAGTVSIEATPTVAPSHVHLRLINSGGKTVRAAQSKKDGSYRFKNLKLVPGDYKIKAWVKKLRVLYTGETTLTVESSGTVSGNLNFSLKH